MISDMDIMRIFGLPNTTTRDWKKKSGWRYKLYVFLQHQNININLENSANKLSNSQINKLFGIPISTLQDWNKAGEEDWRHKVYLFLQGQDKDLIERFFEMIESLN